MPNESAIPARIAVCFTPGGNCTDLIVKALGEAKTTILVQAYSITSAPIAKALLDAHKRGVRVEAIDEVVITGSFNFTKAAQRKNAKNVLIVRDKALATQYMQNWQAHAQHSQPYIGRGVRQ
jgi:phosphatidylserine/phosphatidylglycerophosphate/cardiolipin synthase-like enzyme